MSNDRDFGHPSVTVFTRRRLLWLGGGTIAALGLAACSAPAASPTTAPKAATTTPAKPADQAAAPATKPLAQAESAAVRVGFLPFVTLSNLFFAVEKGWFKQANLEVELKQYESGASQLAPLLSGEIDIITGSNPYPGFFNTVAQGGGIKAWLDGGQEKPGTGYVAVVVGKKLWDQGVRKPEDLAKAKGAKVGIVAPGAITQYAMAKGLQTAKLDPTKDVEWVTAPTPDLVKLLGGGQVDIASLPYDFAYTAQQQGLGNIAFSDDEMNPNLQLGLSITKADFLQNKRDAATRFAMVYVHANRQYNRVAKDPGQFPEALDIIAKYTFLKDKEVMKGISPHWSSFAENGEPNVESAMDYQNFYSTSIRLVERPVTIEQAFDLSVVREAVRRLDAEKPFGPI